MLKLKSLISKNDAENLLLYIVVHKYTYYFNAFILKLHNKMLANTIFYVKMGKETPSTKTRIDTFLI